MTLLSLALLRRLTDCWLAFLSLYCCTAVEVLAAARLAYGVPLTSRPSIRESCPSFWLNRWRGVCAVWVLLLLGHARLRAPGSKIRGKLCLCSSMHEVMCNMIQHAVTLRPN